MPGKWIGGFCASLAQSTGVGAGVYRLSFVLGVLLLGAAQQPVLAWLVIGGYGVGWWLTVKARREGRAPPGSVPPEPRAAPVGNGSAPPPRAAALAIGAPPASAAAPPPASAAAPGARPYLKEFVDFLWSSEASPQALYKFSAHGFQLGEELTRERMTVQLRLILMPYGRVVVWPGWMVFMTESNNPPGRIPPAARWWSVALDFLKEYRRYASLWRLARTGYSVLTQEERDRFRTMLANPNTLIVPLSTVRDVRQERWMRNPRLIVTTDDRTLMLAPNGMYEIFLSFWRMAMGLLGEWHPRFQRILRESAQSRPPG